MINIYCQYSYGGYKTFHIKGIEMESLGDESEIRIESPHDFPETAHVFFQFGGSKIVYRKLDDGKLTLVVREIPSDDVDSSGRPISCAVQFIGDEDDRQTMDNLAMFIVNDVISFGQCFANLFYVRQGLHIEGDKLRTHIVNWSRNVVPNEDIHPVLRNLGEKKNGVFLFVPLSEKFGKDRDVTTRVCEELRMNRGEWEGAVIRLSELLNMQKKVIAANTETVQQSSSVTGGDTMNVENPPISREDVLMEDKEDKHHTQLINRIVISLIALGLLLVAILIKSCSN